MRLRLISSASTETVPDSIFDRSRMSLMRLRRSVPAPWMVRAYSTWRSDRLASGLSASCWPRIRMLFSELLSLLLELVVRQLQLLLLGLQFGGQLLGLLQQPFGLHRRFDAVQDNADPGRELLQEGLLQFGERRGRREFDHRLHLTLEQDGQNDHVGRLHFIHSGPDRNDVRRGRLNQGLPGVDRTLAYEPFAERERAGVTVRRRVG